MIKKLGKSILCTLLERQVKQLRKRHDFQVVAVVGSVGKTSTKLAIANVLGATQSVHFQDGNYNDRLTVPLIFFGQTLPGLFNVPAWIKILSENRRTIRGDYPYKYVVVELGTDGPGQIAKFGYINPEVSVVTAIAPEHMEFFETIDAVAKEEFNICHFSSKVLVNRDDADTKYLGGKKFYVYSIDAQADYKVVQWKQQDLQHAQVNINLPGSKTIDATVNVLGKQGVKIALAAAAAAHLVGFDQTAIVEGLKKITPVPGRMQMLPGIEGTTLIDDTYNSSPLAVKAALDVLYGAEASQRIAMLGSMNEMGADSAAMHKEIGAYCDPSKLDVVVTIGQEAQDYISPAAQAAGCDVKSFSSPYQAGEYVKDRLKQGAIILAKGSQNGVFAEEALKPLLANPADETKLVRQSPYWIRVKQQQFPKTS